MTPEEINKAKFIAKNILLQEHFGKPISLLNSQETILLAKTINYLTDTKEPEGFDLATDKIRSLF